MFSPFQIDHCVTSAVSLSDPRWQPIPRAAARMVDANYSMLSSQCQLLVTGIEEPGAQLRIRGGGDRQDEEAEADQEGSALTGSAGDSMPLSHP